MSNKSSFRITQTVAHQILNDFVSHEFVNMNSSRKKDHIHIDREFPIGIIDGVNKEFFLKYTPKVGTEMVYLNGMLMSSGLSEDYIIEGNKITFNFSPMINSKIIVSYII